MKNRRIVVVAFVLASVLLLGVGYAALTDELTITGNMSADPSVSQNEFQAMVYFSDAVVSKTVADTNGDPAAGTAAANVTADNNKAHFEVLGLQNEGDTVTFKFTIKNESEWAATVAPKIGSEILSNENDGHDADEVFEVEWSWNENTSDQVEKTIDANGGTLDVYVTVTLKDQPTEAHTASYTVSFTATQK